LVAFAALSRSDAAALDVINEKSDLYVAVPGAGVYFLPAPGLVLSSLFDGFEAKDRGIEVIVANIEAALGDLEAGFTDASFKSRGMELKSRGDLTINGAKAILFKALHPDGGTNWGKWIMLAENGGNTLIVNAVFVSGDAAAASDLEVMLKGVFVEPVSASIAKMPSDGAVSADALLTFSPVRPIISSSPDEMPPALSSDASSADARDGFDKDAALSIIAKDITTSGDVTSSGDVSAAPTPAGSGGFDKDAALRMLAEEVAVSSDAVPKDGPSSDDVRDDDASEDERQEKS
jgi:hypothetical protein